MTIINSSLSIHDEYAPLKRVIIGLGAPYLRDKEQAAADMQQFPLLPNTARKAEVLALTYPTEEQLTYEYADFVAALQKHGVDVLRPDPKVAYSFDYTCPRDIGFTIGDTLFISSMAVPSRADEYKTILRHLADVTPSKIVHAPNDTIIEGGDVIVWDERTVLVGINTRTDQNGVDFLHDYYAQKNIDIIPLPHKQLHLDCCLAPLGMGHLLIHPDSLNASDEAWQLLKSRQWITVNEVEREHLATNILSVNPHTIIARDHPSCARVNRKLTKLGYTIEAVTFDGVPATGGSFRCASLVLQRTTAV